MKNKIIHDALPIVLLLLAVIGFSLAIRFHVEKRIIRNELKELNEKYISLLETKTRIDTVYKEGKIVHRLKTEFKTITDTLFVSEGKHYSEYLDTIESPDLSLKAKIIANDLHSIDYSYKIREKLIIRDNILYKTDTMYVVKKRGGLYGNFDVGLDGWSAGLQYQTKKRLGIVARYNEYERKDYITVGVSYRIF